MTQTQKIIAVHCNKKSVHENMLVLANTDMVLANDITAPIAINEFKKFEYRRIFSQKKIAFVMDHFTPNKDIKAAEQCKQVRNFAQKMKIENFFDVGNMGIEHVLLPEKGLINIGDLIIGADSHTCTYGALGAFSTGVGSTDVAVAMYKGKVWLKVPSAIKIILKNKPQKWVSGKDIILYLIGKIGVDGARYKSIEFSGEGLKYLSMSDRFCIANMGVEAGAKNAIFENDEKTIEFINNHKKENTKIILLDDLKELNSDHDAIYESEIEIDLSKIELTIAFPHLPENTKTIEQAKKEHIKIDQVVIGSCTNGRLEDLMVAAEILKGKNVCDNCRVIIIPATQKIYLEALKKGYLEIFINSGCAISTPTCGPCLGGHMGVLAKGEKALTTTNRNFVGRMGHKESEVYLASPAVAAATAIKGEIASPFDIL